jgi:hypothetical protein
VDNLNGFKLLGKMIRVDHIHQYKLPKASFSECSGAGSVGFWRLQSGSVGFYTGTDLIKKKD